MSTHWSSVKDALREKGCLEKASLNEGASPQELEVLERHLGVDLPVHVKEFLSEHNGQAEDAECAIYFGSPILSTSAIKESWDTWRSIDEEEMNEDCAEFMASDPVGYVKAMYTNPKWIPLTHDFGGNHVGIDFDPDERGQYGQIIAYGRDEDTKKLKASDFAGFIEKLVSEIRDPRWEFTDVGWQFYSEPEAVPKESASKPSDTKPWWKLW